MRRTLTALLLGGAAFFLALAALTATVVEPALLKAPREQLVQTFSTGSAEVLNSATGELEEVELGLRRVVSTYLVDGEPAGDGDTAVYAERLVLGRLSSSGELEVVDDGETDNPATPEDERVQALRIGDLVGAFDRKSGAGRPDHDGDTYDTDGLTFKFPFDTQRRTYDAYDQTAGAAYPVEYVETIQVQGLTVYRFTGTVPEIEQGQYGVLEGSAQSYSNAGREFLVEPVTGSIVSISTAPETRLRLTPSSPEVVALRVDPQSPLTPDEATITDRVDEAKDSKSQAQLLQRAPLVLVALGLALLIGGVLSLVLGRGRRDGEHSYDGEPSRLQSDGAVTSRP